MAANGLQDNLRFNGGKRKLSIEKRNKNENKKDHLNTQKKTSRNRQN